MRTIQMAYWNLKGIFTGKLKVRKETKSEEAVVIYGIEQIKRESY